MIPSWWGYVNFTAVQQRSMDGERNDRSSLRQSHRPIHLLGSDLMQHDRELWETVKTSVRERNDWTSSRAWLARRVGGRQRQNSTTFDVDQNVFDPTHEFGKLATDTQSWQRFLWEKARVNVSADVLAGTDSGEEVWQRLSLSPRIRLAQMGAARPDIIDAKLTDWEESSVLPLRERALREGLLASAAASAKTSATISSEGQQEQDAPASSPRRKVTTLEQSNFKYAFDNNVSSRLVWVPLAKQLLFRAPFPYDSLDDDLVFTPYEDYIPVQADLSDLVEKLEFAIAHDDWSQKVAERLHRRARERHNLETNFWYVHTLLLELARLQHGVLDAGMFGPGVENNAQDKVEVDEEEREFFAESAGEL